MSLITRMRKQTAVYWAQAAARDDDGQLTFAAPVEIDCRWDDEAQEFIDSEGRKVVSRSIVYVDRVMIVGDMLYLGTLASLSGETDPRNVATAYKIRGWARNPDIKANEFLLTAKL